jgi:hypothetical protein
LPDITEKMYALGYGGLTGAQAVLRSSSRFFSMLIASSNSTGEAMGKLDKVINRLPDIRCDGVTNSLGQIDDTRLARIVGARNVQASRQMLQHSDQFARAWQRIGDSMGKVERDS